MNNFLLSSKAKSPLIKRAKYTQLTWGKSQRNDYLTILDNTFQFLADEAKLGINCDYISEGYHKYPQASQVVYYKELQVNQILIVRTLHKTMDVNSAL
ncbi:type II toxin-antitoxin system RelE/ParE family toxin [Colwellia piezophila]|uniref:type II toxin-antitoxin system RelE/ParE family toxin n=1 Tax=Colwellia piezophila TaxID=211668 RepID=UPI000372E4BE|nr:type II toxin-antitoxin system RelE/ParE family toxin [Colwellia piezophila]